MRISLVLLVVATLSLFADTNARSTDTMTRPHLRQKFTSPDAVEGINVDDQTLRVLTNAEEIDDSEDSEEERGVPKFPSLAKLKALRNSERITEIKEALSIAKREVKAAAEAAAKAATAKRIEAISEQLDDLTVQKILKDPEVKSAVFGAWHQEKLEPQLVFNAFALPGKYTNAKWDGIANAYLDYVTEMALAAARNA